MRPIIGKFFRGLSPKASPGAAHITQMTPQGLRYMSSSRRSLLESQIEILSDNMKKPVNEGYPTEILDLMMGQFSSDDVLVCDTKTMRMWQTPSEVGLHKIMSCIELPPDSKIIIPVGISEINLSAKMQKDLGREYGSHLMLSMLHFLPDKKSVDIYMVDNNGMMSDDFFQIGGKKGEIQKSAYKACRSVGLNVRSMKSNIEPTHATPKVCGISSVHNVKMVAENMTQDQTIKSFFDKVTEDGGIADPLVTLKLFADKMFREIIDGSKKELDDLSDSHSQDGQRY